MLQSNGYKRLFASFLLAGIGVLQATPAFALVTTTHLPLLASGVGGVGILHASVSKSYKSYLLATLAVVISAAQFIPSLVPYVSLLREIAAILGASALGQKLGEVKTQREYRTAPTVSGSVH